MILRWLPVVSLFCVGLLIGHQAWKRYENYVDLRNRLGMLEAEKGNIVGENRSLLKQIEWYNDPVHLEEKAKRELNLKKEGEGVIVIIDDGVVSTTMVSSTEKTKDKRPWWKLWR